MRSYYVVPHLVNLSLTCKPGYRIKMTILNSRLLLLNTMITLVRTISFSVKVLCYIISCNNFLFSVVRNMNLSKKNVVSIQIIIFNLEAFILYLLFNKMYKNSLKPYRVKV